MDISTGVDAVRAVAFYLPQFHTISENDAWWGEGFTDWVNVRNAKPLFSDHNQPRIPDPSLGYYDLRDVSVMRLQAALAKKYNISGFCFYHYWFGGKRLLQQPVENYMATQDIDFPYCLCWANEPWTRAWDGRERNVLMPQSYGGEEEWIQHFYCLLPAFRDERYIKIEGKPIFLIYRLGAIKNANKMISVWRRLAEKSGLHGLHIITMLTAFSDSLAFGTADVDAVCEFFPTYSFRPRLKDLIYGGFKLGLHWRILKRYTSLVPLKPIRVDYNFVWQRILNTKKIYHTQYRGVFVGWDNSPRKGFKAVMMDNASPDLYEYWLKQQVTRILNDDSQAPLLFINAWNEWAEGAYLEPDNIFGDNYLQATKHALSQGKRTK